MVLEKEKRGEDGGGGGFVNAPIALLIALPKLLILHSRSPFLSLSTNPKKYIPLYYTSTHHTPHPNPHHLTFPSLPFPHSARCQNNPPFSSFLFSNKQNKKF